MVYLRELYLPDGDKEFDYIVNNIKRKCYNTLYPFKILSQKQLSYLEFEPITILYGGNGSGKTTLLNIIAEKLKLTRGTIGNSSSFFEEYLKLCACNIKGGAIPQASRIITSDDVFDFVLKLRMLNEGVDDKREKLFAEYLQMRQQRPPRENILQKSNELKKIVAAQSMTQSMYVKRNLGLNLKEESNGESAFAYFREKISENALYLLDEPENSLSPERQMQLVDFLAESARFFGCQFIIATHSPFVLALKGAKIYDLDEYPVTTKKWTQLHNVRVYYEFFQKYRAEFEK
ncbi:AAA family ATPase [Succinispira mobilis]|uniref:AAA family ATPase n=1 Tax=Succinispira mobilis TaxID=78120 RepID=UPI0003612AEB